MDRARRDIMIVTLILALIGVVMVYSSTSIISARAYGSSFNYILKHIFTMLISIMGMLLISRLDYQNLKRLSIILLVTSFVMLLLVFIPGIGVSINGARRWINLGLTNFQPSEFVKLSMVVFLSDYMSKNLNRMNELKYGIMIPLCVMIVFQVLFILQPDFGGVVNMGILTLSMLFIGGAKLRYLLSIILSSIPVMAALIVFFPYRLKRVTCFLDPWQDPQGCGFQLVQSFIAFGRGHVFGVGIGNSKQKLSYLPEAYTDFIFSLIGEELGLIGVMVVIGLFIWLITRGLSIAKRADAPFGYYLSMGLTIMIGVQTIVNFFVATGLMPTKGLPLPFVSYGGSALLVNMLAVGILMNIAEDNMKRGLVGEIERLR
ncbi:MAG: putative lipid II flippase FtsW [Thermodesulfovibrionia bacterium]